MRLRAGTTLILSTVANTAFSSATMRCTTVKVSALAIAGSIRAATAPNNFDLHIGRYSFQEALARIHHFTAEIASDIDLAQYASARNS
jgi:hypothetical protein